LLAVAGELDAGLAAFRHHHKNRLRVSASLTSADQVSRGLAELGFVEAPADRMAYRECPSRPRLYPPGYIRYRGPKER
jgi:hypothetical protein